MFHCRHVTFGAFEEWSFVLRDTRKDGQIFISRGRHGAFCALLKRVVWVEMRDVLSDVIFVCSLNPLVPLCQIALVVAWSSFSWCQIPLSVARF